MAKKTRPENIEEEELLTGDIPEECAEEISQLKCEIEELKEKLRDAEQNAAVMRLQADFDNFRKRSAEQLRKATGDGAAEVLIKFIPALDVVNQALAMITDEKVAEGVRMIHNQLNEILVSCGVEEIAALGKPFDHNLHSAMMQVSVNNPDQVGQVVEVFQKGYILGNRVLRHSVVKVGC